MTDVFCGDSSRVMIAFTDYPIVELGDVPGKAAAVREVRVLSFDGNKYCYVDVCGVRKEIKAGYLYKSPGRFGEVPCIDVAELPSA